MKLLMLMRHGKSDWDAGAASDHARPLAPRGVKAAQTMGRVLDDAALFPDLVVTSSAIRARSTAELVIAAGGDETPLEVTDALYGSGPQAVLDVVHRVDDAVDRIMLVGHQPTWSVAASMLVGGGRIDVRTATVVGIGLHSEAWTALGPGVGILRFVLQPRMFR